MTNLLATLISMPAQKTAGRALAQLTIIAVAILLSGCLMDPFYLKPGTTFGEIKVSKPRVTSRERLVNDRLEEEAWLKKQLDKTDDQVFGIQGKSDVRSVTGIFAQAGVQADQGLIATYKAAQNQQLQDLQHQADLKNLDYQIALKEKQNNLAAVTSDPTKSPSTVYDNLSNTSASSSVPVAPTVKDSLDSINQSFAKIASAVPTAAPTDSTAMPTPIEHFRDQLAYREEIRNEIIQNALDDAHDLHGNTLYRLSFDTTVIPANDTSAWAMVNVLVLPPDKSEPTPEEFADIVNNKIASESHSATSAIVTACPNIKEIKSLDSMESEMVSCLQNEKIQDALNDFPPITGGTHVEKFHSQANGKSLSVAIFLPNKELRITENQAKSIAVGLITYTDHKGIICNESQPCELAGLVNNFLSDYLIRRQFYKNVKYDLVDGFSTYDEQDVLVGVGDTQRFNHDKRLLGFEFDKQAQKVKVDDLHKGLAKLTVASELYGIDKEELALTPADMENLESKLQIIRKQHISAYGATPKESVQRISDVLAQHDAVEFALAVKAVTGAANIDSTLVYVNQIDGLFHALRRQPLVVGFTDADSFGWMIGPKYVIKTQDDKPRVGYRHVPIQNGVAGIISVPLFWDKVRLCVERYWQPEDGSQNREASFHPQKANDTCSDDKKFEVNLPSRPLLAFNLLKSTYGGSGRSLSLNNKTKNDYVVTQGQPASLTIMGENLWRGASVLLGGQAADSISVLPDMGGIVAKFNEIQPTGFIQLESGKPRSVDLNIVTSEGSVTVGTVEIQNAADKKPDNSKWSIVGNAYVVGDGKLKLKPDSSLKAGFTGIKLSLLNAPKFETTRASFTDIQYIDSENIEVSIPKSSSLVDGAEYQLRVEVTKVQNDAKPVAQTIGSLVYYATGDAAKASYTKNAKTITVTFPAKFKVAYPALNNIPKVDGIVVYNDSKPTKETVKCSIPTSDDKSGSCKLALSRSSSDINKVTIGDGSDNYPDVIAK